MDEHQFQFSDGGTRLVALVDLDQHVSHEFDRACMMLLNAEAPEVTIDLGGVEHIDSACLGVLIFTANRARDTHRRLRLRIPKSLVEIFDLMSMRDLIPTDVVE